MGVGWPPIALSKTTGRPPGELVRAERPGGENRHLAAYEG